MQIHGYHVPISREVFEANYRILAATKAQLSSKGVHYQMGSGPRIAAMVLRDEGRKDAQERGDFDDDGKPTDSGANVLLTEIKRLTTIIAPSEQGWDSIPIDSAISRKIIDADEWQEALSAIVFFTCHYALARKSERGAMMEAVASVLTASTTALSLSEYMSSLPKSTPVEPSVTKAVLSVPR
ncbi:MAG: hypothetical protein ACYCOR_13590 [Acidobacteriaceae bacterium]